MKILPSSLERGCVFYPHLDRFDDIEFIAGMGRVIVIGVIRAKNIWVGQRTQIHTFDHIECDSFRSECDVKLHSIECKNWIEVDGHLGTFSVKASRVFARGSITAAKNLEVQDDIGTMASINVGGHIVCGGSISAHDGINCGNTITAGGEIFTINGLCAGACTWRHEKQNNRIAAKVIRAGSVFGDVTETHK